MNRMNLYDVTKEGQELDEILTAMDGDLTPELEARFDAFLKAGKDSIVAAAHVVLSLEASEAACKAEAKRLAERADSFSDQASNLKQRILYAIDAGFSGKLKTETFTIWAQTSAPTIGYEVAADADLAEIQKAYPEVVRTKCELDKLRLKIMRAEGLKLPDAVTAVENPGTRFLRIK